MTYEMGNEEQEEEFGGAAPEFRPIDLPDGSAVYVDERDYPLLKEWDWHRDADNGQAVRIMDGKKLFLYNETVKRSALRQEDHLVSVLPRRAVRHLFAHLPQYRELIVLSSRQRITADAIGGYALPSAIGLLGASLTVALKLYYLWEQGERFVFEEDKEGLTPGKLVATPHDLSYPRLGTWMATEFTGEWAKASAAPTGLAPQTFEKALGGKLRKLWRDLVLDENGDVDMVALTGDLAGDQRPVTETIRLVKALLAEYQM